MRTRVLSLALVACLAVGASACGGGDGSSDATAAVIEQVGEICSDWKATLGERGDFPVDGFDPASPSPEDLPTVGDYLASGHAATEEAITQLRALSPPAEVADEVESLVSALEAEFESVKVQTSAAQAGDVEAFTATLDDAASSQETVEKSGDELGTSSCSF